MREGGRFPIGRVRFAGTTVAILALAAGCAPADAGAQVEVDPASVGMDAEMLAGVDALILDGLADGAAPGASLAIGRHGQIVRMRGYGVLDTVGMTAGTAATPSTIWDLASLTKVIGTTSATMMLVDDGALDMDAPVVDYLPTWASGDPRKGQVTVRQLLLHQAGLPAFRRWYLEIDGREAYDAAIDAEPLEFEPGTRTVYSDIGVMTLARVLEVVSGEPLDVLLERRLFGPLGMDDTGFTPAPALLSRIAPTEIDTIYRNTHVHGVVHDENADAYGGVSGHAGLFSTAEDLARFAQMMLDGGVTPEGTRLIRAETIQQFTARQGEGSSRGLGWDTPSGRSSAGDYLTSEAFGHTGYTGTSIWMDPELDLFVILLTNRVNPTRENSRHTPLRRAVADLAAQSITDTPVTLREGGGEAEPEAVPAPAGTHP